MMKKITSLLLLWVMVLPLWAQFHDPVSFSVSQKKLSDSEFEIVFTGKAEAGWHVYSTDIPDGGPTPATINFDEQKGVEPVGKLTARGKVHKAYDNLFGMEVSYMENTAVFAQKMRITDAPYSVKGSLNYRMWHLSYSSGSIPPMWIWLSPVRASRRPRLRPIRTRRRKARRGMRRLRPGKKKRTARL